MKKIFTRKQLLVLLGAALYQCALCGILINSNGVILAQIRADIGCSMVWISIHNFLRSILGALLGTVFTKLYFRINPRRFLFFTILSIAAGYLLMIVGAENALWYLIPLLICPALTISVIGIPYVVSPWFPNHSGFAVGFTMAFSGVGGVIFNPVTAALIERFGWQMAIVILSTVMILFAAIGLHLVFKWDPPAALKTEPEGDPTDSSKVDQQDCRAFLVCVTCFTGAGVCTALVSYISMYAESIGYSLMVGASVTSFIMVGNITGKILYGISCDRIGNWKTAALFPIVVSCGIILFLLGRSSSALMYSAALLYGFTFAGSTIAVTKCATNAYQSETVKKFLGIHVSINGAVGAVVSLGTGYLFDTLYSFVPIFLVALALSLLSSATAWSISLQNK